MFNPRNANAQSKNLYMVNINSRIWISVGILSFFCNFSIGILSKHTNIFNKKEPK